MGMIGELWDNTVGGALWKPLKKATGLSDVQLALLAAGVATGGAALAGGAAAGGLGAAGAASAGAGTAGAAGAGAGGLLGTSAAAGTTAATAGTSAGSLTGGLLSSAGTQAAAPITNLSVAASPSALQGLSATAGQSGGLMGYVKPVGEAMGAAQSAKGLLGSSDTPQPPPQVQSSPLDLSGVLNANQQEQARQIEEDMRRRQSLNDFAAYAMKGGR